MRAFRHKIGHIGQKPVTALNKSYSPPSFFLQKESKQRKNTHYLYIFLQHCPMQITAPAAPLTVVARRAYPSPLNAARPSTDSLRSPTPGRLASVNLAARQFLAIAYFALLVTASDLAGLTALNASLFCISRIVGLF